MVWDELLSSASGNDKRIPSKNVLIFGDAGSGKRSLIEAFNAVDRPTTESCLPLRYSSLDVKDEDNMDTLASLCIYSIESEKHAHLISNVIRKGLDNLFVLITLDWSRPDFFVENIEKWTRLMETEIPKSIKPAEWNKAKRHVESKFREYNNFEEELTIPLENGVFSRNLGVQIAIVCTKSDLVYSFDGQIQDYTFDYIQQILRIECLKYGASLLYTQLNKPDTIVNLKNYMFHSLFKPANKHSANIFSFDKKPQVIERDTVFVPLGWDSFGKIKVLRETFDCESAIANENESTFKETIAFSSLKEKKHLNTIVKAELEQEFLSKQISYLNSIESKNNSPATTPVRLDSKDQIETKPVKDFSQRLAELKKEVSSTKVQEAIPSDFSNGISQSQNQVLAMYHEMLSSAQTFQEPATVVLKTLDGVEFAVPYGQLKASEAVVSALTRADGHSENHPEIPPLEIVSRKGDRQTLAVPHVSSLIMSKVINYLASHTDVEYDEHTFKTLDADFEFFDSLENNELLQIAYAANILAIPSLLHSVGDVLAKKINTGKDAEEITKMFDVDALEVAEPTNQETADEEEEWEEMEETDE